MPEDLQKSYVAAHYRHAPNGGLVFVHGYTNKVVAAPEDLTNEYFKEHGIEPEGEPLSNPGDATTSFRVGDEVFVKYSHLHDQHFLTGMVVGVRKDKWHKGKLVLVKEPTGIVEAYAPASLAHVKKQEHESRKHEIEPHLDETGKHIKYQHLTDEQLVRFHDLHRLWYRLHRMGEALAYKDNKDLFVKPDGSLPKSKKDLSSQQKIQLEKLNPFPVVPVEKLIGLVSQSSYNDASHVTAANKLLEEIKALEKSGAPTFAIAPRPRAAKLKWLSQRPCPPFAIAPRPRAAKLASMHGNWPILFAIAPRPRAAKLYKIRHGRQNPFAIAPRPRAAKLDSSLTTSVTGFAIAPRPRAAKLWATFKPSVLLFAIAPRPRAAKLLLLRANRCRLFAIAPRPRAAKLGGFTPTPLGSFAIAPRPRAAKLG